MSERTERNRRYFKTEGGKAAKARAQAKWRQSKPKGKRGPKPSRVAVPYTDEDRQRDKQNVEALEGEKQRRREEYLKNPPVNQGTVDTRAKRVWQLMDLFEPRRGMLTRSCRTAIQSLLERISPIQDALLRTIAKNYNMGKPMGAGGKWWVYSNTWPYNVEESEQLLQPVFFDGRHSFIEKFDRHFARYLISERRMVKQEREQQLVACLHVMLPD